MKYTFLLSFLLTFTTQHVSATELSECKSKNGDNVSWSSDHYKKGYLSIERINGENEEINKLIEKKPFIKDTTPLTIITSIVFESQPDVIIAEIIKHNGKINIFYDNKIYLCEDNN